MNISFMTITDEISFSQAEKYLPFLPAQRREKVARYKPEHTKLISLCSGLLLQHNISRELGISPHRLTFFTNPHGKLYLPEYPDYHFSLSHSENGIAFASSSLPVGIDIEQIQKANLSVANRFFTPAEQRYIQNSPDSAESFFEVWTAKEAYVKMLGTGLSTPMTSFDLFTDVVWHPYMQEIPTISLPEEKPLLFTQKAETFLLSVCSHEALRNLPSICHISFQELADYFL